MIWSQPVSNELKPIAQSNADLDHARMLVARILEFVVIDQKRLGRFLDRTGFKLEDARDLMHSPLFLLSVLDTAIKDDELLGALQEHEQISSAIIELAQAEVAFHVVAELTRQREEQEQAVVIQDRARL